MRHSKKRHKLGRTATHRKATLAALSNALIAHKRITTTVAKAKALRTYIEPLITRAKEDSQHNRRQVFRRLQDNSAVSTLFTDVSEQVGDRPGGYTRVVKLGRRSGDGAHLAMIELVDYNDVRPDEAGGGSKRTRRGGGKGRRRSKAKGTAPTEAQPSQAETETTKQVDPAEKGVETETVETDVADEQAEPVTDRTETGDVPEEEIEAAKEAIDEQEEQVTAESAGGAPDPKTEAPEAEEAKTAEPEAPEVEAADAEAEAPAAKGSGAKDEASDPEDAEAPEEEEGESEEEKGSK